jgi:hypothetical protein
MLIEHKGKRKQAWSTMVTSGKWWQWVQEWKFVLVPVAAGKVGNLTYTFSIEAHSTYGTWQICQLGWVRNEKSGLNSWQRHECLLLSTPTRLSMELATYKVHTGPSFSMVTWLGLKLNAHLPLVRMLILYDSISNSTCFLMVQVLVYHK